MFGLSPSESRTPSSFKFVTTSYDSKMEMGTSYDRFYFEIIFNPEKEGCCVGCGIQILEDMLRCCVIEFEGSWERFLSLVEFVYNNSYQTSIKTVLYEALYRRKCRTPLY